MARCGDLGQNENWWQSQSQCCPVLQLYNETINGPLLLTEAEERQILRNTIVVVSFTGQAGQCDRATMVTYLDL